ncbi:MAG: M48 family metallopeptidase [Acidithiobacillus sp.]
MLVRAPVGCPEALIAERVQKRAAWISRQLAEFERYRPRTPARQYVNGESHLYLGRQYRLKLLPGEMPSVKLARGRLLACLPGEPEPERVKALLHRWYLDRFKSVEHPRLIVRAMRSRWGSLSRAGTMTLNAILFS